MQNYDLKVLIKILLYLWQMSTSYLLSRKICLFILALYINVLVLGSGIYNAVVFSCSDTATSIEQTLINDLQFHYACTYSKNSFSQVSLKIQSFTKQIFNVEQVYNDFFLLEVQKYLQCQNSKSTGVFLKVFRI